MARFAGINRSLQLVGAKATANFKADAVPDIGPIFEDTMKETAPRGIFLSQVDLENDLARALSAECLAFTECDNVEDAVKKLQKRKAITMGSFLGANKTALKKLAKDDLANPLHFCVEFITKK